MVGEGGFERTERLSTDLFYEVGRHSYSAGETPLTSWLLHPYLVGEVGVEPTQPEGNGFTDRPSSPTLALPYIKCGFMTFQRRKAATLSLLLPAISPIARAHYPCE